MLREGLEDLEYFRLLKQVAKKLHGSLDRVSGPEQSAQCARALSMAGGAVNACGRVAESLTVYTKDPADLYRERDALAEAIEAVSAALASI